MKPIFLGFRIGSKFRKGQTQVLVNVEMFTHGMNVPEVDTIVMARPTDSEALCAQMIGRGARLTDKKTRFIIVEVNDNITKHHEYLFNPSDLLEKIRPTRDRGTKRVHEYPVDPKVSLFSNRMNDLSGLQYVVGQTFGVEIEITSEDESIREHEFEEYAEEIIQLLKEKVDTYPDPLQYGKGKNITDQWRVENDSSCGWEVISPILKNEADFFELKEVCMVLTDFLNDHDYLVINHRTGLHLTLATKFSKNEKIKSFIYCLQRLERGLFTLVAPSRRYYFSGEYHYEEPNEYCQPVNMVEDIDELITDDESKRYYSVNFTHSLEDIELLEVRMHSGTSVYQKIIPWISLWMMIFNATRFRFGSPGFRGEVFEGNNVKISQSTAEWEDIFWLLKKEDIPINNKLKEILWNRRKELSTYWEKAIPNRVKSWRDYGWFDSEEIIDSP